MKKGDGENFREISKKHYENVDEDLTCVGKYNIRFNEILGIDINGTEIIINPDYIGINPNEKGSSIELIKEYDENIMVGIKLDIDKKYLYVSTVHDVQESKIIRRLHSGRLKKFSIDDSSK